MTRPVSAARQKKVVAASSRLRPKQAPMPFLLKGLPELDLGEAEEDDGPLLSPYLRSPMRFGPPPLCYGCGSPIKLAGIDQREGAPYLDLRCVNERCKRRYANPRFMPGVFKEVHFSPQAVEHAA